MSLLGLNQRSRQFKMSTDPVGSGGAQSVNNNASPTLGRLNHVLISDLRASADEVLRQAEIAHATQVAAIEMRAAEQLKSAVLEAQMQAKAEFAQVMAEHAQRHKLQLLKLRQEMSQAFAETRRQADEANASQIEKFAAFSAAR